MFDRFDSIFLGFLIDITCIYIECFKLNLCMYLNLFEIEMKFVIYVIEFVSHVWPDFRSVTGSRTVLTEWTNGTVPWPGREGLGAIPRPPRSRTLRPLARLQMVINSSLICHFFVSLNGNEFIHEYCFFSYKY